MKFRKVIALISVLAIALGVSSCGKKTEEETTLDSAATTAEETTGTEDTTADTAKTENTTEAKKNFVFDSEKATRIGEFTSEIYGKMTVWFQDDTIAIKDEFGTVKFALDSQGYSPDSNEGQIQFITEDMNFDGYVDFRLLSSAGTVNSYFYCWLWDMNAKTFSYYAPLAAITSPVFNKDTQTVESTNRISATTYDCSTYKWVNGALTLQTHKTKTVEEEVTQSTEVAQNTASEITNGVILAYVTLYGNPGSDCRWFATVEDENIVDVLSQTYDDATAKTTICFQAHGTGTTTVAVRFALDKNSDYVSEKIFNVTADDDLRISIIETQ